MQKGIILQQYLKDCGIIWSESYCGFLISYFQFVEGYPKFKYVTVSIYFIKQNFRLIKEFIAESPEEKHYWFEDKIYLFGVLIPNIL
jgi:hypothetical protein